MYTTASGRCERAVRGKTDKTVTYSVFPERDREQETRQEKEEEKRSPSDILECSMADNKKDSKRGEGKTERTRKRENEASRYRQYEERGRRLTIDQKLESARQCVLVDALSLPDWSRQSTLKRPSCSSLSIPFLFTRHRPDG